MVLMAILHQQKYVHYSVRKSLQLVVHPNSNTHLHAGKNSMHCVGAVSSLLVHVCVDVMGHHLLIIST